MSTSTLVRPTPVAAPDAGRRAPARARTLSLDVLRGLAVLGMLLVNNQGLESAAPAQLRHSVGGGLTVADVVFPLFLFVAGLGMGRSDRPAPLRPVLRRCALLFAIGCLLVSAKYQHLSVSTGVLQHIALASLVAYAVLRLPRRWQARAAAAGLLAAWALPALVALPGTVAGSWEPGTTLSSAVERLVTGHVGKEQVVASVVSALTVLAGVQAARTLRGGDPLRRLLAGAAAAAVAGLLLARTVPVDKALWTPSYVLVTAGICAALLAGAVALLDRPGGPGAAVAALVQPLRVLGANAIAVYVATSLLYGALLAPCRDALVGPLRALVGDTPASVAYALSSVLVGWLLCAWLWRRRVLLSL